MSRKPLILPNKVSQRTKVTCRQGDGELWLTDRRRGIQLAAVGTAAVLVAAIVGGIVWIETAQNAPIYQRHRYTESILFAMCLIALGVIGLVALPLVMAAKNHHRRFRVRVDDLRRAIYCERWWFGIRFGRREIEINAATWEVDSVYFTYMIKRKSGGGGAVNVIHGLMLLFMGPLGWIIALASNSSREEKRRAAEAATWDGKAMPRLTLLDQGEVAARITVSDEATAQDFLLAWDRAYAR
ncbi:MAG: hypothetical protein AAGF84_13095 [Planctomycetota bacterium]